MVLGQPIEALLEIGADGAVRMEQLRDMQVLHALDAVKVGLQPVAVAREQRDGGADDEQRVIAAEQDAALRLEQRQMPGRVAGRFHDLQLIAAHRHRVAAAHERRPQALRVEQGLLDAQARGRGGVGQGHALLAIRPRERIDEHAGARDARLAQLDAAHEKRGTLGDHAIDQAGMVQVEMREEPLGASAVHAQLIECVRQHLRALVGRRTGIHHKRLALVHDDVAIGGGGGDVLEGHLHEIHVGRVVHLLYASRGIHGGYA